MKNIFENLALFIVRTLGFLVRLLPDWAAIGLGRSIGFLAYYFDLKHRALSYGNLKIAFAKAKSPDAIKRINKQLFINFGQNFIELLRLPLLDSVDKFEKYVKVEGKEHIYESLKKEKGVILLAMHFGSWELASLSCAMFGRQYKVMVKPQRRFSKLDDLLNSYRSCGGNVVLSRGLGTREILKSLKNNEIIGLVVDQGGKDGVVVPFWGRGASLFDGAIRIGLKFGVPICFIIIIRDKGCQHRMVVHKPLELIQTGDTETDIISNLKQVVGLMEHYITRYPSDYMWFYKIWKYGKEANILILDDGKTGHLRQSQATSNMLQKALAERAIVAAVYTCKMEFKNRLSSVLMSVLSSLVIPSIYQGRLELLGLFLTKESFEKIMSVKADYIISTGSSSSGINCLVSHDQKAKSIVILKPSFLSFKRFHMVVLPQHDVPRGPLKNGRVVVTQGAPNLVTPEYLNAETDKLLNRFSHLKVSQRIKIGLLIGGDNKNYFLHDQDIKLVINQILQVAEEINADVLVTTSRRTSAKIENLLGRELKSSPRCMFCLLASRDNIPEAYGGILGLCDILIVSGDSISMISEAASSGRNTIVFPARIREGLLLRSLKHSRFIDELNHQGFIISSSVNNVRDSIYNVVKNKSQTQRLDDNATILEGVRRII